MTLAVIVSILRIPVAEGLRFEAVSILCAAREAILAQQGCRDYIVYEQQAPESAVVLVEAWECTEDFEAHIDSEEYCHIQSAVRLSGCPAEAYCASQG